MSLNVETGDAMAVRLLDLAGVCTGPGPCDTTPFGAGKNWVNKVGGLPLYMRAVAKAFRRKGLSESEAIQRAIGVVKNWAEGKGGVTPATRARAVAAVAEWERKKARAHSLTASPSKHTLDLARTLTVDLAGWNEQLHPRNKGKFAPKGTQPTSGAAGNGGHLPANMAGNVRDFQRRNGLPVTGVIDTATGNRIRAAAAAKAGGGHRGRKAAKSKKPKPSPQMRAAARAINKLTPAQRAAYRQAFGTVAGYRWAGNTLVRA